MNILKHEQRAGLKAFLFWMAGMFLLSFVGMIKFKSYASSGSMTELLASFPRIVLAVMGVAGVDMNAVGGYAALLSYYILVCAVIYAVHLGAAAVSRESVDKTYEFVFTKPCSRAYVLGLKLVSAYIYLFLFCVFNGVFLRIAVAWLKTPENVNHEIVLLSLSAFLVGALFVALSALLASAAQRPDRGMLYGNLVFLYAFLLSVICNMLEKPGLLKLISPFNYFAPSDMAAGKFDLAYAAATLFFTALFLYRAIALFKRKDLM